MIAADLGGVGVLTLGVAALSLAPVPALLIGVGVLFGRSKPSTTRPPRSPPTTRRRRAPDTRGASFATGFGGAPSFIA